MSFFDFLNANPIAAILFMIIVCIVVVIILIGFIQGRAISFWPPRIEAPKPSQKNLMQSGDLSTVSADIASALGESGLVRIGDFQTFTDSFSDLINNARDIVIYFIHSRRWRENHLDEIDDFLSDRRRSMVVFLPDLENSDLIQSLKIHFDDGDNLESMIKDAYRFFIEAMTRKGSLGINVFLTSLYPTYSFYKFDEKIIMAMYPTTPRRKRVPTFEIVAGGKYWNFVMDDIQWLQSNSRMASIEDLKRIYETHN